MRTPLTFAFVSLALLFTVGCPKDDSQPPPIPSATPAPQAVVPPPPTPAEVTVELDAAPPVEDVVPDVKKVIGKAPDPGGLRACCTALKQNAASMPPPNNAYAQSAAALCEGLLANGAVKSSALAPITAALKGAGLPAACR